MGPVLVGGPLGLPDDQVPSKCRHDGDGQEIDKIDGGKDGEDDEPEPQSDINFLIDDVQPKDTEGIKLHDGS